MTLSMRRFKKALLSGVVGFLVSFLFSAPKSQAFEYVLQTNVSPSQKQVLTQFFEKAKQTLPPKLKKHIPLVKVRFEKLTDSRGVIRGVTYGNTVTLANILLSEIEKGSDLALGTLLHETVHVYDNLNLHTAEELSWIRRCKPPTIHNKSEQLKKLPEGCKLYSNMATSFSGNPYFLQVAGWTGRGENGFKERSVNSYELTHPKETLAVNMDAFLTDPHYKCRRPGLYKILSSYFEHVPFQEVDCEQGLGFVIPATPATPPELRVIDPKRIYQIHYLLADKGEEAMSGWGHSMIRIVLCAPDTPQVGPDCLLDVRHHLVISFRAFIGSMTMSAWDGLRGKYPSRLFMIPMSQVIDEFAKKDLRALKSLPLKLSRAEIRDFILRTVESHWAYNGKYAFISNNCATETLNLLKSALLKPEIMALDTRTPMDLYDSLVRVGLGDPSVFMNQESAIRNGHYFESYEHRYKQSFDVLSQVVPMKVKDFREFLALSAQDHRELITQVSDPQPKRQQLAAAFYILETASQRQLEAKVMTDLQKVVLEGIEAGKGGAMDSLVKKYQTLNQMFAQPALFLVNSKGYGLPSTTEFLEAQSRVALQVQKALILENEVKASENKMISSQDLKDAELFKENIKLLLKLMKAS